jgi:hypothetical protein
MPWHDSPRLECQCGAAFAGVWSRDRLGRLASRDACPLCGSTGRIFRAAIAGWTGLPEPPPEPAPAPSDAPPPDAPMARAAPPPASGPALGAPKPRAPRQGALGL